MGDAYYCESKRRSICIREVDLSKGLGIKRARRFLVFGGSRNEKQIACAWFSYRVIL